MSGSTGPLQGLRVLALEQAVAAPLCSRHLADLGADVIKVERPDGGDFARDYDTFVDGVASHFVWLNYGKRSVVLDLKSPEGIATLRRLLAQADVFISNLSPGSVERIVSERELAEINPMLVSCQISGYGPDGPYRDRKAFDLLVQGEAGVTANTGTPEEPAKPGVSLADLGGGIYAATAILAALHSRNATGVGAHIHISMFDVLVEWMSPLLLAMKEGGVDIRPAGTRHATITPYGPFVAADGVTINVAVQNDRQWRLLCGVLELDDMAQDDRLKKNSGRLTHRDEVEAAVAAAMRRQTSAALAEAFDSAGIPWGRLNRTADVVAHPQLAAEHRWRPVRLPHGESALVVAPPFRFSNLGKQEESRVPALGEHNGQGFHARTEEHTHA